MTSNIQNSVMRLSPCRDPTMRVYGVAEQNQAEADKQLVREAARQSRKANRERKISAPAP